MAPVTAQLMMTLPGMVFPPGSRAGAICTVPASRARAVARPTRQIARRGNDRRFHQGYIGKTPAAKRNAA
jgi:hypothetical protein